MPPQGRGLRPLPATAYALVSFLLGPAGFAIPAHAQTPSIAPTVAAIISFTRWPTPPDSITLCVVGPAEDADALFGAPLSAGGVAIHSRRVDLASDRLGDCNAVYAGRLALAERQLLNRKLEGLAVLTVGEASPDCTELTMFCLRRDGGAVTFSTNIDMIARGGVRINPRVLQLGRRPATQ